MKSEGYLASLVRTNGLNSACPPLQICSGSAFWSGRCRQRILKLVYASLGTGHVIAAEERAATQLRDAAVRLLNGHKAVTKASPIIHMAPLAAARSFDQGNLNAIRKHL